MNTTFSTGSSPKTTVSSSGDFIQSEVKTRPDPVETPKIETPDPPTQAVPVSIFSSPEAVEQRAPDPEPAEIAVQPATTLTAKASFTAEPIEPVDPTPSAPLRSLALVSTLAVDPARAAYIKQFTDADPNHLYVTPGSPGYVAPTPPAYTDAQYNQYVTDGIARIGTAGFSQTSTGALQYTNNYSQDVAVLYGTKAGGLAEPSGIRIVRPGQTVVLPSGAQGAVASAQLPKGSLPIREVGVAAVGYAPFTKAPTGGSSSNPIVNVVASITTVYNALGRVFNSLNSFVVNEVDFVTNYALPVFRDALQKSVKVTFDGLSSIQKSILIGNLSSASGSARSTLTVLAETFRSAFTKVSFAFIPYSIEQAYQASASAKTSSDQVHAGLDTFAAEAPLAGAAIGLAIGGPPGAGLGYLIGGAAGLGVSIGNGLTRLFGL